MKVVILCGGQGIRLREVTEQLPKPMSPIGDRPLLWHIMKIYAHYGIKDFILCLGYKGWKIKEFFLNYRSITADCTVDLSDGKLAFHEEPEGMDWKVTLAETGDDVMTGARLWRVRKYLQDEEHFCVTYGDGLADINIPELINFHREQKTVGTITGVQPVSRYGQVYIVKDLALGFYEKSDSDTSWINGGFMVFDGQRIWQYLDDRDDCTLETDALPAMVRERQLSVFKHYGFWIGMDTVHEHTALNDLWKEARAPWKVWK
jgi:glucose-1-phosphate cytidylyltransferase